MMVFAGAVARFGVVVLRSLVRLMFGAVPWVVAVMVLRRFGGVVAAARVVVVVGTPRGWSPVGNIATCIQFSHHVDRPPRVGIAIYRAPIGIAVNREAVGIIAGRCPCYAGADVCIRVACMAIPILIYVARAEQHGCCC